MEFPATTAVKYSSVPKVVYPYPSFCKRQISAIGAKDLGGCSKFLQTRNPLNTCPTSIFTTIYTICELSHRQNIQRPPCSRETICCCVKMSRPAVFASKFVGTISLGLLTVCLAMCHPHYPVPETFSHYHYASTHDLISSAYVPLAPN